MKKKHNLTPFSIQNSIIFELIGINALFWPDLNPSAVICVSFVNCAPGNQQGRESKRDGALTRHLDFKLIVVCNLKQIIQGAVKIAAKPGHSRAIDAGNFAALCQLIDRRPRHVRLFSHDFLIEQTIVFNLVLANQHGEFAYQGHAPYSLSLIICDSLLCVKLGELQTYLQNVCKGSLTQKLIYATLSMWFINQALRMFHKG